MTRDMMLRFGLFSQCTPSPRPSLRAKRQRAIALHGATDVYALRVQP